MGQKIVCGFVMNKGPSEVAWMAEELMKASLACGTVYISSREGTIDPADFAAHMRHCLTTLQWIKVQCSTFSSGPGIMLNESFKSLQRAHPKS